MALRASRCSLSMVLFSIRRSFWAVMRDELLVSYSSWADCKYFSASAGSSSTRRSPAFTMVPSGTMERMRESPLRKFFTTTSSIALRTPPSATEMFRSLLLTVK